MDATVSMPSSGYDTTSLALTYTIFAIASYPEVERCVLAEVDAFWCGPKPPALVFASSYVQVNSFVPTSYTLVPSAEQRPLACASKHAHAPAAVSGVRTLLPAEG